MKLPRYALDKRSSRRQREATFRGWGFVVPEVDPADFMTHEEAKVALDGRWVTLAIIYRILEPAFLADGTEGVTKASVDAELRWLKSAGRLERWKRRISHLFWFV